jgi:hypothetical protein
MSTTDTEAFVRAAIANLPRCTACDLQVAFIGHDHGDILVHLAPDADPNRVGEAVAADRDHDAVLPAE